MPLPLSRFQPQSRQSRIRLAIVGNSHLAALKLAEREGLVASEEFDICYYGGAGSLFSGMDYHDGFLDMKSASNALLVTDGRFKVLPVDEFDAFLFHGAGYSYSGILRRYSLVGMAPNKVSSAFLLETARQTLNLPFSYRKVPLTLLDKLEVPIVISTIPLKARGSNVFEGTSVEGTDIARVDACLRTAFEERGMHYIGQPAETITDGIYTDDRFSIGSVRLKGDLTTTHDDEDFGHMNAQYGALVLRDALVKIRELVAEHRVKLDRQEEARKKRIAARERRMQR